MQRTMTTTGGALLASALTTALGLLTLLFAPLDPMRQLGLLTAVTILLDLIAAFLVLWALYHRWRRQEFGGGSHHPTPSPRQLSPGSDRAAYRNLSGSPF